MFLLINKMLFWRYVRLVVSFDAGVQLYHFTDRGGET